MDVAARKALALIRRCVACGRYLLLLHFTERMDERGLFWPDVLAVLDAPKGVRSGGLDRWERPKWLISGTTADELPMEVVCVLDEDERGNVTVFITVY